MATVDITCPHCGSRQKVATRRVATEAMCLKCQKMIKDPYLYKVAPEAMELNVRLKGKLVSEFGTTKLDELKSKADEYTGKFEPVDDDASGEFGAREETTVRFESGMYAMPRNETRRISTATKTYAIGLSAMALLATIVVVVGIQMLAGDGEAEKQLQTAGGGNERVERYDSGAVKAQWNVSSGAAGEVPHGLWTEFFRTGEKKLEGHYDMGNRVGRWVGWHENGSQALECQYENDKPVGTWTEWHPTGNKSMEGEYVEGEKHGEWRTWYYGGELESVKNYDHGEPVGEWIALWPDGLRKSVSKWEDGKRTGRWVSYHDNAVIEQVENWENGLLEGETFTNYRNKFKQVAGQWSQGRKVGEWSWWHPNGELSKQGAFEDGLESGEWKEWHDNAELKLVGQYVEGMRDGEWIEYDTEGNLAVRRRYDKGTLRNELHYFRGLEVESYTDEYEDGTPREEWTYLVADNNEQLRHGWYRAYYSDGQLAEIGTYLQGRKHGVWQTFDHDGLLIRRVRFEDGREVE